MTATLDMRLAKLALVLALGITPPAQATLIGAASEGQALDAESALLGNPLVGIGLPPLVAGSTPGTYNESDSLAAHAGVSGQLTITAGLLSGAASFDGATVTGGGGIENLHLQIASLISLNLDSLISTSSVSGDWGSLVAVGDSSLSNAFLTAGMAQLALDSHAAPNTTVDVLGLLGVAGVNLILNEQFETCSAGVCGIETNALHLTVNPVGLNLVTADIILGHSKARLEAEQNTVPPGTVPEPGVWSLLLLGLGALGLARRRGALNA